MMFNVKKIFKSLSLSKAKRQRRGYSLIELGIVLGVVAGLIVGVLFLAQTISTQNRLTQLNQLLTRVVATTIRITSLDGSITANADLAAVLRETGEFATGSFVSTTDNKFKTPFSGATFDVRGAADNRFALVFANMPANACFSVAQNLLQARDALHSLNINDTAALSATGTVLNGGTALTVSTATASNISTACADNIEIVAIYN